MSFFRTRPGEKIESVDFLPVVTGKNFSNCRLEWCRGKKVVFEDCNFASSLIKLCYFHRAEFKNCNFTGCTIVESNFRGAKFKNCDFKYAVVRATSIEVRQVLKNLPYWENAQREFLRSLRKNAESTGDVEDVRLCLNAEMEASAEHWRSALRQVDQYYQEHYSGAKGWLVARAKYWGVKTSKWFWGYGESPVRLVGNLALWMILVSMTIEPTSKFFHALMEVAQVIVGVPGAGLDMAKGVLLLLVASRYIFLGLFAAVFVRRFARR